MLTESQSLPVLTPLERRVLGVLVEKAKTTPDAYPLSLNALVTGCNQKSNRDPVLNLSESDVEETLAACQHKGLVVKIMGGRVDRWRHNLYEAWRVEKVELAILAELLLRGAQTEGELRARASRMEPIADLEALRQTLQPLAERRLVVYLGEPGKRGTLLTHGFHEPAELEQLRSAAATTVPGESSSRVCQPGDQSSLAAQLAELRTMVVELQTAVADLTQQVQALKANQG